MESQPRTKMLPEDNTENKNNLAAFQREGSFVLQREGSFVRTGSGRKLPKIPGSKAENSQNASKTTTSEMLNTSLPSPLKMSHPEEEKNNEAMRKASSISTGNNPAKPKALEFWEGLETVDRSDFRYNTIHRMSVGRRMLPKAPEAVARSHSLDRNNQESLKNTGSLNSSFSGEHCDQ